jgi:Trehalose receptor
VNLFLVGQFFGNMPVEGVLDRDSRNIRFKWTSLRTIYSVFFILVGGFEVSLMVWKGFKKGFDILIAGEDCDFHFIAKPIVDIILFQNLSCFISMPPPRQCFFSI